MHIMPEPPHALLMEVVVAARRLLAMQTRLGASSVPESLADAIERDFLMFDLEEAASDLRRAVEIAEVAAMARTPRAANMEVMSSFVEL